MFAHEYTASCLLPLAPEQLTIPIVLLLLRMRAIPEQFGPALLRGAERSLLHRASLATSHRRAIRDLQTLEIVRRDVRVDPAVATDDRASWDARPLADDRNAGGQVGRFLLVWRDVSANPHARIDPNLDLLVQHTAIHQRASFDRRVVHNHRVAHHRAAFDAHARRHHAVDHRAVDHAAIREQAPLDVAE